MCQNPISGLPFPRAVSPARGQFLFDLCIKLLFQLLFQRARKQATLDSKAG
jgi:hypothetical protein